MSNLVNFINSWAQSIILAIVIATIIEMIIPNGNNKKYVKTIIGIYVIFVMISPIITKFTNKNFNIDSMVENLTKQINKNETNNIVEIKADTYIEDIYVSKMKDNIKNYLKEKSYSVEKIDILIENLNQEKYGTIKELNLRIVKQKNDNIQNKVNAVEQVKINISNTNLTEEVNTISVEEINSLKQELLNIYGIEKIYINEH